MILKGDTVRLKCHFKTFDGSSVDPTNITLTIYEDADMHLETIQITDTNRLGLGVFYFDYVTASELNEFIFEFAGSHNNKPILARGKVKMQFTK
ncbi:hypothetical protein H4O14_16800 [Bacillus sp. PAMC26568]|nr:hypothetical protein H4O14_16800 [Bacillus sp. PAMC26568]